MKKNVLDPKSRIQALLNYTMLSKTAFGKKIGDRDGTRIGHVLNERNMISERLAKDIVNEYPEINYRWIYKGVGKMKKNNFSLEECLTDTEQMFKLVDFLLKNDEELMNNGFYRLFINNKIKDEIIRELKSDTNSS